MPKYGPITAGSASRGFWQSAKSAARTAALTNGDGELLPLGGDSQRHRLVPETEDPCGIAVQELWPHLVFERNAGQLAEDSLQ